jgi:hypothetical protein
MPPNPNSFVNCWSVFISKGPHNISVSQSIGQDLIDCHNICATSEMTHIVCDQLEYGPNLGPLFHATSEIWDKYLDFSSKELDKEISAAKQKFRIFTLTRKERFRIHQLMKEMRGEHDCCIRV